jgi:ubiquinone biosynthesis protein
MEPIQFNIPLRRQIRNAGRLAQIVNIFARHGYWTVLERIEVRKVLNPDEVQAAASESQEASRDEANPGQRLEGIPARLRRSLEELGPAFVKLGQVLAVREDLLPQEFTDELRKLHSNVETLPFEVVRQRVLDELGPQKFSEFSNISSTPLAAGSIAQVHAATLKDGTDVVIKIQRPDIKQLIETDLDLMGTLAQLLEKYIPESRFIRPTTMVQALADALRAELDFIREGGSMSKMAANFANHQHIHFPSVYWNLSTAKVLTLSRMEGIPADQKEKMLAAGIDVKVLMSRGLGMFMKMVFADGFFHGDLHPGNILAKPNSEIGLLDFGLALRVSSRTRENLAGLLLCLSREDFDGMVNHYLEMADPSSTLDVSQFQHDVANAIAPFVGLSLKNTQSGNLLWELAKIAARHHTPFPQDLIIFVKTMATFEGVATRLDPDFRIMDQVEEFAGDLLAELYSPKRFQGQALTIGRDVASFMRQAPIQTRKLLNAALDGNLRLNVGSTDVAKLTKSLDRTGSRLSVAFIIGSLLISSSILTYASPTSQINIGIVGAGGFILAGILALYIVVSILRSGRL